MPSTLGHRLWGSDVWAAVECMNWVFDPFLVMALLDFDLHAALRGRGCVVATHWKVLIVVKGVTDMIREEGGWKPYVGTVTGHVWTSSRL